MKLRFCLLFCILCGSANLIAAEAVSAEPAGESSVITQEQYAVTTQTAPDYMQPMTQPRPHRPFVLFQLIIWVFIWLIPSAIVCYFLAQEKGKNTVLWPILGAVPVVNVYALLYLVGSEDRDLKNKIEEIRLLLKK